MPFDAFISYSHAADGKLAPSVQRGLQQLAKPWSRRQALRVFRDDTGLSVNPALWQSITDALDASEYFILLASPAAAASEWVNQEISYWMASRPDAAARMLPVLTAGTWVWDNGAGDIDWAATTAAPAALAGVFTSEPRHLDLVWAQSQDDLDLRNTRFREAVADLAAPIHGIPKDELESEDVRQHRKALRVRRGAVAALLLLVVGLGVAGVLALRAAETARGALRDLEDANGNIDDLTAEGEQLAAKNRQAEADLAATDKARAEAEALAADAREDAEVATAAREQAEAARAGAEEAQAEAEAQQADAEAARAAALEAQAAAEQGQDAAEQAAAEAAQAEADARRQEAQARAGEVAAQDARAAAEEASAAAAAAEAQARADERAATAASDAARQQEAEARRAEAAALAGERLAQAAEADAVAAEAAARAAEAAAAQAAAEAEELRQTAEAAARAAEAATKAATLARSATAQTDPGLNALLAVESYCAVGPCAAGGQPQGLLRTSSAPARRSSLLQADAPYDPAELDPFVPMIDAVARHQDLVRQLPGWSGHGVDVAVSGDGRTIAALRDDGTARVWHPAEPGGVELPVEHGIGIAVSDDGTTVAVVTAEPLVETPGVPPGERATITFVDLSGGGGGGSRDLIVDQAVGPQLAAAVSFRPGSHDVVLISFGSGPTMLFDPSIEPAAGEALPDYTIAAKPAAWYGADRIVLVGKGTASVIRPGQPGETPIDGVPVDDGAPGSIPPPAPSAVSSAGGSVVIGYDDGSIGLIGPDGRFKPQTALDGGRIDDLAISPDERVVITTTQAGPTRRLGIGPVGVTVEADVGVALSRRTIDVATGRGPAQVLVVAVEERIEVWTPSLSWAGAFVRRDVVAPPTDTGALLGPQPGGYESSSPEGSVRVDDVELPALVSADGSTLLTAGSRPRVGPIDAFGGAVPLDLPPDHVVAGPLASTSSGSIAAAVVDGPAGGRSVMTFDGRSGARLATYELPALFATHRPADVEVVGLLVSDDAVVIQRREEGPTRYAWDERIEIRPLDAGTPATTVRVQGLAPMALMSGPGPDLYVAHMGGTVTAYPVGGGAPVDVLDLGDVERASAIGVEAGGGGLMVVGYYSGRVDLVNVQTGALLTELSGHDSTVTHAAIGRSPGGLRVSTTSEDEGVVRTLDDPDLLRATLCAMAGRDLTDLEWRRFVDAGSAQPCARGLS